MKNIISIIIIVASIATFIFIVQPKYQSTKELRDKDQELDGVLDNARRLQSVRDELLSKRNELSDSDIARLEKLIPESADNIKLILEFQSIADQYNLSLETASVEKDESEDASEQPALPGEESSQNFEGVDVDSQDYGLISMNFSLSGEYNNFLLFLRDIEQNLRITDIQTLSLTQAEQGFNYEMSLITYWLKDNI